MSFQTGDHPANCDRCTVFKHSEIILTHCNSCKTLYFIDKSVKRMSAYIKIEHILFTLQKLLYGQGSTVGNGGSGNTDFSPPDDELPKRSSKRLTGRTDGLSEMSCHIQLLYL
jgi:hypothetical protein